MVGDEHQDVRPLGKKHRNWSLDDPFGRKEIKAEWLLLTGASESTWKVIMVYNDRKYHSMQLKGKIIY